MKVNKVIQMKSRQQKRKGKLDLHYLKEDGMIACNPRNKEASHRAHVENIATEDPGL